MFFHLDGWKDRIWTLIKGMGKVHTLRASASNSIAAPAIQFVGCPQGYSACNYEGCTVYGNQNIWDPDVRYINLTHAKSVKVSLTFKYTYRCNFDLKSFASTLEGMLAALGFLPNAESVWEKVPFSFVVDWFINTDKLLDRINLGSDTYVEIIPLQECLAVKREVTATATNYAPCLKGCGMTIYSSDYTRETGIGVGSKYVPWTKWPSLGQMITGAALGVSLGMLPEYRK
jgi:hypothetical protein